MRVPPRHRQGEEPSARHRVGPWIPVTPVDLVPALAGSDMSSLMPLAPFNAGTSESALNAD